jgi:hypothetical protein
MVVREAYKKGICPICGCKELEEADKPRNYNNMLSEPFSCCGCGAYVGYWYKPVKSVFGVDVWEYVVTESLRLDEWDTDDKEIKKQLDMFTPVAARHFK